MYMYYVIELGNVTMFLFRPLMRTVDLATKMRVDHIGPLAIFSD